MDGPLYVHTDGIYVPLTQMHSICFGVSGFCYAKAFRSAAKTRSTVYTWRHTGHKKQSERRDGEKLLQGVEMAAMTNLWMFFLINQKTFLQIGSVFPPQACSWEVRGGLEFFLAHQQQCPSPYEIPKSGWAKPWIKWWMVRCRARAACRSGCSI